MKYNIDNFKRNIGKEKIIIVGLGYVGLPLAVLLNTKFNVVGFDINKKRIEELKNNFDKTNEVASKVLKNSSIEFTHFPEIISSTKVVIITVPTPIDKHNIPDLAPILSATEIVGKYLSKDTTIVYESTVYPGLTEEECIPLIEKESGLKWKQDFFVGYSPERVNPGDKKHTIDKIVKVVSGDTDNTLNFLSELYGEVIIAGIHKAPNIKTAEAAKVIENTQRDLNIALMNELAVIFNKMNIDTREVLNAAGTKWNFLKFEPGLVGGHCIGVDPYYLTFKAKAIGYHPETILSGRKINDYMGKFIAENSVKLMIKAGKSVKNSKALILGLTFKENISDMRNTKVVDIIYELKEYGVKTFVFDPNVDKNEAKEKFNIDLIEEPEKFMPYDLIIWAVKHDKLLKNFDIKKIEELSGKHLVFVDVKGIFSKKNLQNSNNIIYWRL